MGQASIEPPATVIIPTYNRASSLGRALQSVADMDLSRELYEVVVVDNSSTDDTPRVVQGFLGRGVSIRYLKEARLSLTAARHAGANAASAPILSYLDDDVIVDRGWLPGVIDAFESDDKVGVVGGPILPIFEAEPPDWVKEYYPMSGWLSLMDRGSSRHETHDAYGPNFSVRKDVLQEVAGFPADTIGVEAQGRAGVVEKIYVGSGDVGLCAKVRKAGYKVLYEPKALVHHVIPAVRLTKAWWHSRLAGEGCCNALTQQYQYEEDRAELIRRALYSAGRTAKTALRCALGAVKRTGKERHEFLISYHLSRAKVEFALARHPDLAHRLWDVAFTGVLPQDIDRLARLLP